MSCQDCSDKTCLKPGKGYGKPCKAVENLLPKIYTGRLPKHEHTYDPNTLEIMAGEQAVKLKYGSRKTPKREED